MRGEFIAIGSETRTQLLKVTFWLKCHVQNGVALLLLVQIVTFDTLEGFMSSHYHVWRMTDCPDPVQVQAPLNRDEFDRAHEKGWKRVLYQVGCGGCAVCREEQIERKKTLWSRRLANYTRYWLEQGQLPLFCTFTFHDKKYPDVEQAREHWKNMVKRLRRVGFKFKYFCIHEFADRRYNPNNEIASREGRLHLHCFIYLDRKNAKRYNSSVDGSRGAGETVSRSTALVSDMIAEMRRYWHDHTLAYVLDFQVVMNAGKAASYVTKYVSKSFEVGNPRLQSSQFGWEKFMKEVNARWHGIDPEGETSFVFVKQDRSDPKRFSVSGRVTGCKEVSNPFRFGLVKLVYDDDEFYKEATYTSGNNNPPYFLSEGAAGFVEYYLKGVVKHAWRTEIAQIG